MVTGYRPKRRPPLQTERRDMIRVTRKERPQSRRLTASLFNSESVYPQPESGSVEKDMIGKIQGAPLM
eukprot:387383-Pelagomonas_calceolata.AAC.1